MANPASSRNAPALADAITATRLGKKSLARELLREITELEPRHEQAFLWRAALAETAEEAVTCLRQVLTINPNNQQALSALAAQRLQPAPPPTPASQAPRPRPATPPNRPGLFAVSLAKASDEPAQSKAMIRLWQCPLCHHEQEDEPGRCPGCNSLLSLDDLSALADNRGVKEEHLLNAIQRWQQRITLAPTAEAHVHIALAFCNLNRSAEALPHLEEAVRLRPQDPELRRAMDTLRLRKLVLAVDDSLTVRKLVSVTLERKGFRVLTAADGLQAIACLDRATPDLVLLDITMPKMDGYDVCRTMKRMPSLKSIPVLMLSGKDGLFDKMRGKLSGATDYLTKPFDVATLTRALDKHLPA